MLDTDILLPTKPKVVEETESTGVFEIDGLYPGYGHTLGNSLRRILLSSLPGAAITSVKVDGVSHEFSNLDGVKEDVILILLHLKKIRIKMSGDEPQEITLSVKGPKVVTAKDIKCPGQIEILNPDQYVAEITGHNTPFHVSMIVEKGLGYATLEDLKKEKVNIGSIVLDAIFSPIKRVNYEVEDMRIGDKTDHNRLRVFIETDGSVSPRNALERAIEIMIKQLQAIVGFKEIEEEEEITEEEEAAKERTKKEDIDPELLKTRIETMKLTTRTANALNAANIRTIGGLVWKKEEDLLDVEGLGEKGIQEIKKVLHDMGLSLRQ